jgi:ribose/xylose/arabinose/galactoside ABC-type transport system permease subunit
MFKDKTIIWVLEYTVGGILAFVPLICLRLWQTGWTDAHTWAACLFVICLGVILISCASSMRQRMRLAKRIDTLAEQVADGSVSSQKV